MPVTSPKPLASVSLDLDNQWSYMKIHGDPGWSTFPTYLHLVVPRVLQFLKERNLSITFFIVGQDAALDVNREPISALAAAGHEIGNHSFSHEPWLHLYSEVEIESELARAEEAVERATGKHPIGFRGPGFSLSRATLRVLCRRGYLYDASTFPTFLGPLARAYYFMTANLSAAEKRQRGALFGTFSEGFRPLRPYRWRTGDGDLLEIPVTTMPLFKIPIHASYILYLSGFSRALALLYFRVALRLCLVTGTQPSLLLHPLDFLDRHDAPPLAFFPAMNLPSAAKIEVVGEMLRLLAQHFEIVSMERHARALALLRQLPSREPDFPGDALPDSVRAEIKGQATGGSAHT